MSLVELLERVLRLAVGERATLGGAALVFARVAPIVTFAPLFALRAATPLVRSATTIALTLVVLPIASLAGPVPTSPLAMPAALLLEVLRGALFGVTLALPLLALGWAGRLVDVVRGASQAESPAPLFDARDTPLGQVHLLFGVASFFALGGHRLAIAAFADGFRVAPIGSPLEDVATFAFAMHTVRLVASALALAVAVAGPAMAAMIVGELALGLLGRTAPQIPIYFVGMPLRSAAGIAAVLLTFSLLVGALPELVGGAVESARAILGAT